MNNGENTKNVPENTSRSDQKYLKSAPQNVSTKDLIVGVVTGAAQPGPGSGSE